MNKNLLIKQNNELFNKIQILKNKNSSMTAEITNLNLEIKKHLNNIEELENEIAALKVGATIIPSVENSDTSVQETEIIETVPQPENPEQEDAIELPEDFNYASEIIGNIVIKAAGYINELSASANENKKELINLLLGRTEIAKAEILNIVLSEAVLSVKHELIDTQYNEAVEYFKSVMEQ